MHTNSWLTALLGYLVQVSAYAWNRHKNLITVRFAVLHQAHYVVLASFPERQFRQHCPAYGGSLAHFAPSCLKSEPQKWTVSLVCVQCHNRGQQSHPRSRRMTTEFPGKVLMSKASRKSCTNRNSQVLKEDWRPGGRETRLGRSTDREDSRSRR